MLTLTPPMGWNSWNTFGADISDKLIRETADALVSRGFLEAGYQYLVIDDCWSKRERDENGCLAADEEKFPQGMKAVSDYVHGKGLKFGMYSCVGVRTCAGYPGSFDHEFVDAKIFADWGVDFLKYDFCYKPEYANDALLYRRMGMALKVAGRDILYSACNWGTDDAGTWMRSAGANMYRSTEDIVDNFQSIRNIALSQVEKLCYSAPGCFNDMDMLVVGMYGKGNVSFGGCNDAEYRTHFALWCLFGSPLMIGCDIRNLSRESEVLLKNKGLISINQDAECRAPQLVSKSEEHYCFARQLAKDEYAIAYFNLADKECEITCLLSDVGLSLNSGYGLQMTDVFTEKQFGVYTEFCNCKVQPHDCRVLKAKLVKITCKK